MTRILIALAVVFSLSIGVWVLLDQHSKNQALLARIAILEASSKVRAKAEQELKAQLERANTQIKERKEELDEILKDHSDWSNTKLPFDFNSLRKSSKK